MIIRFNNYAKKTAKLCDAVEIRSDKKKVLPSKWQNLRGSVYWYKWLVFVDEDDKVLDQIAEVQYLLHPTFANPLRITSDRPSKFAIKSSGWGSFWMDITVIFKNGTESQYRYFLDLDKAWEQEESENSV